MAGLRSLTPDKEDALIAAIERGVPTETALVTLGINQGQFYQWLKAAESGATSWPAGGDISEEAKSQILRLSERVTRARAQFEANMVLALNSAVGVVGKDGVPQWRPALEALKNSPFTRERWHEHREVTVNGQATVRIEAGAARQLSIADLARLAGEEYAALLPPGTVDGEVVSESTSMEDGAGDR